jgi:hypothetical protein
MEFREIGAVEDQKFGVQSVVAFETCYVLDTVVHYLAAVLDAPTFVFNLSDNKLEKMYIMLEAAHENAQRHRQLHVV